MIWCVDDDDTIREIETYALLQTGFEAKGFADGVSVLEALKYEKPELIVLDIMLPDGSGLDALKFVKGKHPDVSCIMLSALSKEEDKVNGLNLGADDYVAKPFSVLELTARVNARLRGKKTPQILFVGDVTLNLETFDCSVGGEHVSLNKKEFELLKTLMLNHGKVLSRERLLTDVWGYDTGETRTLDNHVARLRKLGVKIETVFGVGYRL